MRQLLKIINYAAQLMALIDIGNRLNTPPMNQPPLLCLVA